jgi:hypothetical protein
MSNLAKRLLTAEFGGYPAHGSGFVTILSAYEPGANIKDDLRAAHDRIEALEAALKNAEKGFDRIHQALLRTGPKQACGEMALHFLTETLAAVSQMESSQ